MSHSKKEKEKFFYDNKPIDIRKKMEIVIGGSHQVETVAPPSQPTQKRIFVPIPNMKKIIPLKKLKDFKQSHYYQKYDKTPYPSHPGRNRVSYDLDEEDFEYVELNTRDHDVKNFYNVELFFDILEKETGFDKGLVPLDEIQKKYEDDLQFLTPRVQKQLYEYWKKKRMERVEFSDDFDYPVGRPLTQQFFLSPTLENQNSRVPFRRIKSEQETTTTGNKESKANKKMNRNLNNPRLQWKEDRNTLDRLRDLENLLEKLRGIVMVVKRKEELKKTLVSMQESYLKELWKEQMRKKRQAPTATTTTTTTTTTPTTKDNVPSVEQNPFSFSGYAPKRKISIEQIEEEEELQRKRQFLEDNRRRRKQPNQYTKKRKSVGGLGRSRSKRSPTRRKSTKGRRNVFDPLKNPNFFSFKLGDPPVKRFSQIPHNPKPPSMMMSSIGSMGGRGRRGSSSGGNYLSNQRSRYPVFAFMCNVKQTKSAPNEQIVQGRECFVGRNGRVFFLDQEEEDNILGENDEDEDDDEDEDEVKKVEDEEQGGDKFGV